MPTDTQPRGSSSSVGGMLTKKYGGVPMYVYFVGAVIVGGVLWFYIRRRQVAPGVTAAGQPATSQAAAAGMTPAGVSSVPFIPVTEVSGLSQAPASTATPAAPISTDTPVTAKDWVKKGSSYWFQPGLDSGKQFIKDGKAYFWLTDPGSANAYVAGGGQAYYFAAPGVPTPFPWGSGPPPPGFTQGMIFGVTNAPATMGGPLGGASDSGGTGGPYSPWQGFAQTSVPQQYAVVGGQPWGNQTPAGIGGPTGGARRALLDPLAMAAGRANIPTARVLALNTDLRRRGGWIAPPGSVVRVA